MPALVEGKQVIWDSLAICEYLNDKYPEKNMWPKDLMARGWARSVASEMHSGFTTMRSKMSHDLQKQHKTFVSSEANGGRLARNDQCTFSSLNEAWMPVFT